MPSSLRRALPAAVGLLLCLALGLLTVRPALSDAEARDLSGGFGFESVPINAPPPNARTDRTVAPGLEHIRGWISAVGASVGLADLRGLGRAGDACLVDPRDDSVTVFPVPRSGGPQYEPFRLRPDGLRQDATMAPMGCVPADLDEDGDQDILVYYWGRSPVLFLNTGRLDPTGFRPVELVDPMEVWNSTAVNVGDVDGDGHLDVLVGNYFPDGAKVLDPAAADDPRMRMQDSMGKARNAGTNKLLLTTPTGRPDDKPRLVDASNALPDASARSWTLSIGLQNLADRMLPDLYFANDFGPDQLLVNSSTPGQVRLTQVDGRRDVTTPRSEVLGHDSFKGMGVNYSYSRGQRLPMVVVSNITTPFALQESNFAFVPTGEPADLRRGELPFDERTEELGMARGGWSWDIKAGDFDNSGTDELLQATGFLKGERDRWPELQELAMGNDELLRYPGAWPKFRAGDDISGHEHNPFWVRAGDGRFHDLAVAAGIGAPDVTRGFALGDVNGDGLLDALVANQWEDSRLLLNTARGAPPAADLRLLRPAAAGGQTPAIGAEAVLSFPDGEQRAQLYPANGHAGVSDSTLHFGLPDGRAVPAAITWRDGTAVHTARIDIGPGTHTVLLNPDGTAVIR
ncbi:CRTAC1 family protein [Saccharopolyspora shandongensis]|uniref:CRTAC1 family protein n=1 Tax=Saccharopolyspora shandongensis TaxID=418495 RepID=UPI0034024802